MKDQIICAEPDITMFSPFFKLSFFISFLCVIIRTQLSPSDQFMILACDGVWDIMTNQV